MRCRCDGSGNASRMGKPSIALPGSVSLMVSLTHSQTCCGPRCNVTVNARVPAGSPDALTASLPVARAISDASGLRRLHVQQRSMAERRANSPDTTGLRRSLLREDAEFFHSGWESIGEIIARLRQ